MNTPHTRFPNQLRRTYLDTVSYGLSDAGCVRDLNEDSFLVGDGNAIWAVADGMGGHSAGQTASALLIDYLGKVRPVRSARSLLFEIVGRIEDANTELRAMAAERDVPMIGSTIVCMAMLNDRALVAWAGDSRLYRVRDGNIELITRDHRYVMDLIESGTLTEEEAENHPQAHVLTRAVGGQEIIELDFEELPLEADDVFILCSDGLTRHVSDHELLKEALERTSCDVICKRLIDLAISRGGEDNVTAVAVCCTVAR